MSTGPAVSTGQQADPALQAVTRFRVAAPQADSSTWAAAALEALAARPGFRGGRVGRALDDPALLVLVTEWEGPGAYRRALSAYDVRVAMAPLLPHAHDEPGAFAVEATR